MKPIGSLFDKYKQVLRPPQASVEKEAKVVIEQVTSIAVPLEQLNYSPATRTLKLNVPSIIRSELLKHKPEILKALQQTLGERHAPTDLH